MVQRSENLRTKMQIIFQDPYSSLDPRNTIAQAIEEPLLLHGMFNKRDKEGITKRVLELMDMVGLARRDLNSSLMNWMEAPTYRYRAGAVAKPILSYATSRYPPLMSLYRHRYWNLMQICRRNLD